MSDLVRTISEYRVVLLKWPLGEYFKNTGRILKWYERLLHTETEEKNAPSAEGLNGLLVNKTKRSSAVLCDGDVVVFGGAGVKTKEGQSLSAYDSELVYVFNEVCQNDSEEVGSLGEGTSDGSVRRRSKRKKPASLSEGVRYGYITLRSRGSNDGE